MAEMWFCAAGVGTIEDRTEVTPDASTSGRDSAPRSGKVAAERPSGGPSPNFCRGYMLTPPMRSSLSLRGGSVAFKAPCSQPFPAFGQCPSVKCPALSGALRDLDRFRALPSGAGATRNAVIFSFPLSANPRSRGFPSKLARVRQRSVAAPRSPAWL